MKLNVFFKNVLSYSASAQQWVDNSFLENGIQCDYSFAGDFAIADWMEGKEGVLDTWKRIKESWSSNYKAMAEAVAQMSMMSWFHYQLMNQGIEGREDVFNFYSHLYHHARGEYYEIFKDNDEAIQHLFQLTD